MELHWPVLTSRTLTLEVTPLNVVFVKGDLTKTEIRVELDRLRPAFTLTDRGPRSSWQVLGPWTKFPMREVSGSGHGGLKVRQATRVARLVCVFLVEPDLFVWWPVDTLLLFQVRQWWLVFFWLAISPVEIGSRREHHMATVSVVNN